MKNLANGAGLGAIAAVALEATAIYGQQPWADWFALSAIIVMACALGLTILSVRARTGPFLQI
jgi:hypothetical protein